MGSGVNLCEALQERRVIIYLRTRLPYHVHSGITINVILIDFSFLSYILSCVCHLEMREVLGKGLGKRFHMHIHNRFAFPKGNINGASQGWKKKKIYSYCFR